MKRGFTLLEMMLVLTVLGLLLALAPLAIPPSDRRLAADVLASLRAARERAIVGGQPAVWRRDSTTVRFLPDGSSSGGRVTAGEIPLLVDPLTGGIHEAH